jgi:hypothetical protein
MIVINIDKAKAITHGIRRDKRSEEFAPLDVKASIPSEAVAAEAARQAIREKYAAIQASVDAAADTATLKTIVEQLA